MKQVHENKDGIINTVSGVEVNLLDPIPDMINIEDIAHSLSYQCRFGGHVSRFYSVAQHSVMVAAMAPKELKKYGLLHDAAEAYLQDITAPLKHIWGPAYKILEERFMKVISLKFGLDLELFTAIKEFDKEAVEIEHNAFQCGKLYEWQTKARVLGEQPTPYSPEASRVLFMSSFMRYFGCKHL